jgi:hypothetical protein
MKDSVLIEAYRKVGAQRHHFVSLVLQLPLGHRFLEHAIELFIESISRRLRSVRRG